MFFEKTLKNRLMMGGLIFFISGLVSNFLNYFYRISMARMLKPELFGELTLIISLVLIFTASSAPLQVVATRFAAIFQKEQIGSAKRIIKYLTYWVLLINLGVLVLTAIFAVPIQNFLKLSSKNSVYFLAGIVVITLIGGITRGILQGLKRFSQLSFVIVVEAIGRVGLAIILVILGFKMTGALLGFLTPLILVYFLTIYYLRDVLLTSDKQLLAANNKQQEAKEIWRYIFYSFLVFLFLNILLNVDKILVKRYFPAFEAGIFSGFTTLSQAIFIAISLVAGILFPVVASKQAKKEDYFNFLKISSLISLLIMIFGCLVLFLFSKELLLIFFGNQYLEGSHFLGYYSLIMGIFGFVFLLSYFFMALNKFKFLYLLVIGSILEIVLISLWHSNFSQVILMFFVSLMMTLFGLVFLVFLEKKLSI